MKPATQKHPLERFPAPGNEKVLGGHGIDAPPEQKLPAWQSWHAPAADA